MQYWVFFIGGVGGDGFTNLLEHADNITPADGFLQWRIRSKPTDSKVAFSHPEFTNNHRFLRNHYYSHDSCIDLSEVYLTPSYYNLIIRGHNTVIPSHPHYYNYDNRFRYWKLLDKSQHRILLYSDDTDRVVDDLYDKNSKSIFWVTMPHVITKEKKKHDLKQGTSPYYHSPDLNYDTFIDIERVWKDWDYLNDILISIGINLDRKYYEEYLDISKRRPQN